jgi:hypothetical protein
MIFPILVAPTGDRRDSVITESSIPEALATQPGDLLPARGETAVRVRYARAQAPVDPTGRGAR